jgi:hypothetical protein
LRNYDSGLRNGFRPRHVQTPRVSCGSRSRKRAERWCRSCRSCSRSGTASDCSGPIR